MKNFIDHALIAQVLANEVKRYEASKVPGKEWLRAYNRSRRGNGRQLRQLPASESRPCEARAQEAALSLSPIIQATGGEYPMETVPDSQRALHAVPNHRKSVL